MALGHSPATRNRSSRTTEGPLSNKKAFGTGDGAGNRIHPFRHGGIVPGGPLPENPGSGEPKHLSLCSDPLTLDIRPLSPYHEKLFHSVQSLKHLGWTDLQIADHFNQVGLLTQRGHRWIAQSVFSIRKKHEKRLARITDKP